MMQDGMPEVGLIWMLLVSVLIVLPFWRICTKAGYTGWLSILVLIPIANLVFIYFLGFSDWPSLRSGRSAPG